MTTFTPSLLFDATLLWFSTKYCKMPVTHRRRLSAPDVGYHLIYKFSKKCKLASNICFLTVTFHRANYKAIIFLQSIKKHTWNENKNNSAGNKTVFIIFVLQLSSIHFCGPSAFWISQNKQTTKGEPQQTASFFLNKSHCIMFSVLQQDKLMINIQRVSSLTKMSSQ